MTLFKKEKSPRGSKLYLDRAQHEKISSSYEKNMSQTCFKSDLSNHQEQYQQQERDKLYVKYIIDNILSKNYFQGGFFCEYDCGIFSCTFTEKQTYAIRTMDQKSRFVRSFGSKDKDLTVQGFIKDCLYNIKIP